ncbi:MAG: dynamin family protein [Chloroflexia bacterium]
MSAPTTLPERVEALFTSALARTADRPALAATNRALRRARRRLQQPMRVAIVGLIKAGKSTLMNALLGEAVVATGAVEATFNVNWLCWGEQTGLVVHYKDNRPRSRRVLTSWRR